MLSTSNNRIDRPDDIIYLQTARPFNTPEPQEEDSWDLAVDIDIDNGNSKLVSDSDSDSASISTTSISTTTTHTQAGNTAPHTASAAASAASHMFAPVPVNAPTVQPRNKLPTNEVILFFSGTAIGSLCSAVTLTLGAMEKLPSNSGEPFSQNELTVFKVLASFSFVMALIASGCAIKGIVNRLQN